jgi:opacity protein-like surface antigen
MFSKTRLSLLAALALAALLITTAVAIAAKPKPGEYSQQKGNRLVVSFTVKKGKVTKFSAYPKCAPVPVQVPAMKVKDGKFSFKGKRKDVTGTELSIEISGTFTTTTKAKGSYRYTSADCSDSKKSFTAKRAA